MREPTLLIKIPTRERYSQFFAVLNKAQRLRTMNSTRFLITLDSNDRVMNVGRAKASMALWGNLEYYYGESKSKIDAVNRDMDKSGDWDYLLLLSDDMHPQVKGYDRIICDTFKKQFPNGDGVLWINDGHTGKKLNTIVCLDRKYYERFGYLYHPSYRSLFCDNEYTDVAVRLKRVYYLEQVLIEHRHPMNVRGVIVDNLYKRNDSLYHVDRRNYLNRKAKVLA